ncbi:hypothetical protein AAGG49_22960, partial [Stenotrophomonas maltophilia]
VIRPRLPEGSQKQVKAQGNDSEVDAQAQQEPLFKAHPSGQHQASHLHRTPNRAQNEKGRPQPKAAPYAATD